MKFNYLTPYYKMSGHKFNKEGYYQTYLTLNNFMRKANTININNKNVSETTIINKICPKRSLGCEKLCFNIIRYNKKYINSSMTKFINSSTKDYLSNKNIFKENLEKDISELILRAKSKVPVVRLNNMSDILWEDLIPDIFNKNPNVQFYDYTKHNIEKRIINLKNKSINNYHLVYSRTENDNWERISFLLDQNIDVAVVLEPELKKNLLTKEVYKDYYLIDGDIYDNRIIDQQYKKEKLINKGILILLTVVNTNGRKDSTGFVIKDLDVL
ncbi:GP88 family protein [Aliarcobacter butzleri]|uniref:GP88 family protein n=1 Tax=Aliarcobacter butzleri TaxID=28197 RepID=UPI003AFA31F5